jgi:riboflavin biosynthesis pyrimidine reductase
VIVVASSAGAAVLRRRLPGRPWIDVIDAGTPVDLPRALGHLRDRGIHAISAIGGRRTAGALLHADLVSELYLTTSPKSGGEPATPMTTSPLPPHRVVVEKAGRGEEESVRFRNLVFDRDV